MGNLRLHWHRLLNSKSIDLDGVMVSTIREDMPKSVRSSLFKGTHEAHERRLVKKYLGKNDRVLEIGAATGLVSLICAKQCGPGNVLSYEANPVMEPLIRKNFLLNGWQPNLEMKAVTLDGKDVNFFASDNIYSSSLIDRSNTVSGKKITVSSDPFNLVIKNFQPTAIVMDVEGAEIDLLEKADLAVVSKIIVEVHPHITGQESVDTLLSSLSDAGFEPIEKAHKTYYFSARKNNAL